nr:MAG TPA: Lipopolysaccharide assembly protein A domain [Caudoviricetes sp.]
MGSRLFFFRKYNLSYIEDPTLKGTTMTWTVYALIVAILILGLLLGSAWNSLYLANNKIRRLSEKNYKLQEQIASNNRVIRSLQDVRDKLTKENWKLHDQLKN